MSGKVGMRHFGNMRVLPSKRVQARYKGPDGRMHSAPYTFQAKRDADAWLSKEWGKIQDQTWEPPKTREIARVEKVTTPFGEYAEEVITRRQADGKIKATTAALYRKLIRLHLQEKFGKMPLGHITVRRVNLWHSSMASTPSSRANAYGVLSMVMRQAVREELIDRTPCQVEGSAKKTNLRDGDDEVMTPKQFADYIDALPERLSRFAMPLTLAYWLGLRSGEVRGLRRMDLDLEAGEVHVRQQIVKLGGKNIVQRDTKTDSGTRVVALPPHLIPVLKDWLNKQPVTGREGLLFPSRTGGPMSGESLRNAGKTAADAIGRSNLRVHSLRHSSATMSAQLGATDSELMGRFGWSSPVMAKRYSHATKERDRALAAKLSELA
ncbi:MAG: site-specific integrase [Propionicimonas sp.]|nr:site-specific integrase [Propionicimonas sp.]